VGLGSPERQWSDRWTKLWGWTGPVIGPRGEIVLHPWVEQVKVAKPAAAVRGDGEGLVASAD
jgi:hypothetical protein